VRAMFVEVNDAQAVVVRMAQQIRLHALWIIISRGTSVTRVLKYTIMLSIVAISEPNIPAGARRASLLHL
jgi:hypothetical protein